MQKIQLYIEGQRVDMFKDESVTITQSIKNVKEIGKVFTDYSKSFSLPASKINNKIFKHYYNFDIDNGFDARIKKSSNIELNDLSFRDGLIKLEGVDLKDNKPHTYNITFFGSTVTLKDTLGDDKLSTLSSLVSLNKTYDAPTVKDALQDDPSTNDIIVPLITHTQRLTYDSSTNDQTAGNLAYHTGHIKGVLYTDLKYAIRLHSIIEAIESKYPISFSNDFFVNTNAPYYGLFMWLHRKKGGVENLSGVNQAIVNSFPNGSDTNTLSSISNQTTLTLTGTENKYFSKQLVAETSSSNIYSVSVQNNGVEVYNTGNITGNITIDLTGINFGTSGTVVYIESSSTITFGKIEWQIGYRPSPSQLYNKSYTILNFSYINIFTFDITQQIPDMKVIDFLSGLFKTFNLVAYVEKNETQITVKTLDEFYANQSASSPHNIDKYIDVEKSKVNSALPYRKINLQHEDTKTFLAATHEQQFGKAWGKSEYNGGEKLDGSIYDIKTPFAQMKYERLIDSNGGAVKGVQVGYFVDDNQESYYGKPLIFYPIRRVSSTQISFLNSATDQDPITTYNIPSNSVALASSTSAYNMNFNAEQNEWGALNSTPDNGFTNSLFESYYKNFIISSFNPSNRITKVSAYLPLKILLNYTLADRFILNGHSYKINSITTNLETGKSELELLNDL